MNAGISANKAAISPEIAAASLLKVGGVTPFTATDYPGQLAAVVFVQGCPWRCDYCHNPHLQLRTVDSPLEWPKVMALLRRRIGLIDAVIFSGGEATIDPALQAAILEVRALGFRVGLHSAGIYPKRLAEILPVLDWVGLDIKAPFDSYERITRIADSGRYARQCAEMILASGVSYEFRTTIHASLLSEDELLNLAQTLAAMGVQNYALQLFRPQGCRSTQLKTFKQSDYPTLELVQHMAALFPHFTLRQAE
ncbi:anaerobic class III ribonucleotide activase NrdG [Herminiimonas arsenicoxydans]|uniref:Anaerobic class III ribonucleotide activase NrdG n=1 Tax=Herminiimonas arsenicoxydans TaxID=204773 RepID=A4G5P4_HERAR|nr:anaerobic class III ribonucleotide activase NrdG [Herminiimonas arsenicoxydans]